MISARRALATKDLIGPNTRQLIQAAVVGRGQKKAEWICQPGFARIAPEQMKFVQGPKHTPVLEEGSVFVQQALSGTIRGRPHQTLYKPRQSPAKPGFMADLKGKMEKLPEKVEHLISGAGAGDGQRHDSPFRKIPEKMKGMLRPHSP